MKDNKYKIVILISILLLISVIVFNNNYLNNYSIHTSEILLKKVSSNEKSDGYGDIETSIVEEDEETKTDDITESENDVDSNENNNSDIIDNENLEPVIVNTENINLDDYQSDIKIVESGTYYLSGNLNYSIFIEALDDVELYLDNVKISSKKTAAIANINSNDLIIHLKNDNVLSDGGVVDGPYDGCIYSNGHIRIDGNGNLLVRGQQGEGEGIATKNAPITIDSGNINIFSNDDGINTGGSGGTITINGGEILINALGDGIDSNLDVVINGGWIYSVGSANGADSGIDADRDIKINSGTFIATGAADFGSLNTTSEQNIMVLAFNDLKPSDKLFTLLDENDNVVISFISFDAFSTLLISSNLLVEGKYYLYQDGVNTGEVVNGIYINSVYTKGSLLNIDGNSEFIVDNNINVYTTTKSLNSIIDNTEEVSDSFDILIEDNLNTNTDYYGIKVGQYVKLDFLNKNGYTIENLIIKDSLGNEIEIVDNGFVMPSSNVFIEVLYTTINPNTNAFNISFVMMVLLLIGSVCLFCFRKYWWIEK